MTHIPQGINNIVKIAKLLPWDSKIKAETFARRMSILTGAIQALKALDVKSRITAESICARS